MKKLNNIEAVILDMDGVLVDTEHLHMKAFELFLAQHSLKVEQDFLRSMIGTSIEDNFRMLFERFTVFRGQHMQEMIDARNRIYLDLIDQEPLQPISGIIEILEYCKKNNLKTALASSSDKQQIDKILLKLNSNHNRTLNFYNSFNTIVAGDSVRDKKPAPDIYLKALNELQEDAKRTVAIEDSQAGITSAKNAGIFCFAFENPYNNVYQMSGTDYILNSLHDFVKYISNH